MATKTLSSEKRQNIIKYAGIVALIGNLVLAIAKLLVGFVSGSLSVMGDGIDTTTDVIIACMTLIIAKIIAIPSDNDHPWGHSRADTIGTVILSFVLAFAGLELCFSSIEHIMNPREKVVVSQLALIVTSVSIFVKIILAVIMFVLGKRANSSMIKANAQNMINDILISGSVLIGLILAYAIDSPLVDPIVALLVSFFIIKNAIQIFWEMNVELMDGNTNKEAYQQLFAAVKSVDGVSHPHRVRMRKIAAFWDVDLDIEVDGSMSVVEAHEISEKVARAIRTSIPDVYDVMVHIEPAGHLCEDEEGYGLSESDL